METIPIEKLYSQPVVQELLNKIESNKMIDIENITIPYVIKDKVLMSPGIWNDFYYSNQAIHDAFLNTRWDSKEIRSIYADHEDNRTREWVGEVINPRMKGEHLIGDLVIVDKATAQKLGYGAKFGISPKVHGTEDKNEMLEFAFDNFSVVINPAVKTAYINNMETMKKDKIKKDMEETKMTEENKPEEKVEEVKPEEEVKEEPKAEEVQEEAKPAEEPAKPEELADAEPVVEAKEEEPKAEEKPAEEPAPEEPAKEEPKEEEPAKEELSDVTMELGDIADQIIKLAQMISKKHSADAEEPKPEEAPKKEEAAEEKPAAEEKEEMHQMQATIKELNEKLATVTAKMNEPEKKAVKTAELSASPEKIVSSNMDGALLSVLQRMGGN